MVLVAALGIGCGGDDAPPFGEPLGEDLPEDSVRVEGDSAWSELAGPAIDVSGGAATSAGGIGRDGGLVRLRAGGAITFDDASVVSPIAPPPPLPAGGLRVRADRIEADLAVAESIRLSGTLPAEPSGHTILSTRGDIVIDGRLRAGGNAITLRAPRGTIYVAGAIDARAAEACEPGPIVMEAASVVIMDEVLAAGGERDDGTACAGAAVIITASAGPVRLEGGLIDSSGGSGNGRGGDAGDVSITAAAAVDLDGSIDAMGGSGRGPSAIGGAAGDITISAADVSLRGRARLRGGAAWSHGADATGGDAGVLTIDASGAVDVGGVVDARGGPAAAQTRGGAVKGGAAGTIDIGVATWPAAIAIAAPITAAGGSGRGAGGAGGHLAITGDGDVLLVATVDLGGGDSAAAPGAGGLFEAVVGPTAGGITFAGVLDGGGGASSAADAPGGAGGELRVQVIASTGPLIVEDTGTVVLDGGVATGSGAGGGGGVMDLRTRDGDASLWGELLARGGAAEATGGRGGGINLWTDTDADGLGGHLAVEPSGFIDVSGGDGAVGGSGRNNGGAGVGLFPDDLVDIAVLLNSETYPGPPDDGSLINRGMIVSRGGAGGGWGGDVVFHGRQPGGEEDPVPGMMDLSGSDGGKDGDFAGE